MTTTTTNGEVPRFVWVLGFAGDDEGEDDRGSFRPRDARMGRQPVPADLLRENVTAFVKAMGEALSGVPAVLSGFTIDSIEISAEVSATGKLSLLGNGAELTGTGGISFTLTRVKTDAAEQPRTTVQ